MGLTLFQALFIAEAFNYKNDQPEDQAAIISGWFEYYTGNPWPKGLPTQEYYFDLRGPDVFNPLPFYRKVRSNYLNSLGIPSILKQAEQLFNRNHFSK